MGAVTKHLSLTYKWPSPHCQYKALKTYLAPSGKGRFDNSKSPKKQRCEGCSVLLLLFFSEFNAFVQSPLPWPLTLRQKAAVPCQEIKWNVLWIKGSISFSTQKIPCKLSGYSNVKLSAEESFPLSHWMVFICICYSIVIFTSTTVTWQQNYRFPLKYV